MDTERRRARVLVTGLDSFTGRYLGAALAGAGFDVHGMVRQEAPVDSVLANAVCHVVDLRRPETLKRVVERVAPRHVIHLAAVSFVAHGSVDDIYLTNVVGTRNLLGALAEAPGVGAGLDSVILASSANVYGNTSVDPLGEGEPFRPANDYAVSKAAMEMLAAQWRDALPITVTRPFNYTGVGQSKRFLIPKIVDAFARRLDVLELGNLDVYRDFSDVRDVVSAYVALLHRPPGETFNICSGVTHSLRDVVEAVAELSGHFVDIRVNPAFVRSNEVRILRGDPARLRAAVDGWQPRPFRETLSWMVEQACREQAVASGQSRDAGT